MSYSRQIGTKHKGCIILLVDQSGSMSGGFGGKGGGTKAQETARALNRSLQELSLACQSGDTIKDRCDIGVIGYGAKVGSLLTGPLAGDLVSIANIAHNPARIETVKRKVSDGAGGLVEIDYPMPVWLDAASSNGTPMTGAFDLAHSWATLWTSGHPDSFPPVVINITDGAPASQSNAKAAAERLQRVTTTDGELLLFNAHISESGGASIVTPGSAAGLPDAYAKFLFEISSVIPPSLLSVAAREGLGSNAGARGFIYNANVEAMIQLLRFGTAGTMNAMGPGDAVKV